MIHRHMVSGLATKSGGDTVVEIFDYIKNFMLLLLEIFDIVVRIFDIFY